MIINNYILMFSLLDIENPETNFILNIIVLSVVILVHINYLINPNLKTL